MIPSASFIFLKHGKHFKLAIKKFVSNDETSSYNRNNMISYVSYRMEKIKTFNKHPILSKESTYYRFKFSNTVNVSKLHLMKNFRIWFSYMHLCTQITYWVGFLTIYKDIFMQNSKISSLSRIYMSIHVFFYFEFILYYITHRLYC